MFDPILSRSVLGVFRYAVKCNDPAVKIHMVRSAFPLASWWR